jgi:hypothetical protein
LGVVLEVGSNGGAQGRDAEVKEVSDRRPNGGRLAVISPPVDVIYYFGGFRSNLLERHPRQIVVHAVNECVHTADEASTCAFVITV